MSTALQSLYIHPGVHKCGKVLIPLRRCFFRSAWGQPSVPGRLKSPCFWHEIRQRILLVFKHLGRVCHPKNNNNNNSTRETQLSFGILTAKTHKPEF